MKASLLLWFAKLLVISMCVSSSAMGGQNHSDATNTVQASENPNSGRTVEAYRLDFSLNELENAKKINARQYSMNLNTGDDNQIKIGTRVPVEQAKGEMQYLDVGTSIWSRLKQRDDSLLLEVRADVSSFANTDQAIRGASNAPLLREVRINASTIAVVGKPMVLGTVEDSGSPRQYQLEVTVSRLK